MVATITTTITLKICILFPTLCQPSPTSNTKAFLCNNELTAIMTPSIGAPQGHLKLWAALDRYFQKMSLLISAGTSKTAKKHDIKVKEHQPSLFSAPEFHFGGLLEDATSQIPKEVDTLAIKLAQREPSIGSIHPHMADSSIGNLPISVLSRILEHLLVSDQPLVLGTDASRSENQRSHVYPEVLASCRLFYHVGMPLLYGSNTMTTSTAADSKDFDKHLLNLPGRYRQLIKHVKLQIDWADELWARFPLIARVLGEIVGLKSLEILIFGPARRQGAGADMMLRVEEKCFVDLVMGDLKALKKFKLEGFDNKAFAKTLEAWVSSGGKSLPKL